MTTRIKQRLDGTLTYTVVCTCGFTSDHPALHYMGATQAKYIARMHRRECPGNSVEHVNDLDRLDRATQEAKAD